MQPIIAGYVGVKHTLVGRISWIAIDVWGAERCGAWHQLLVEIKIVTETKVAIEIRETGGYLNIHSLKIK
jgi:hypothetical protein